MLMNRTLLITLSSLALFACTSQHAPVKQGTSQAAHEINFLRGSYQFIGDDIRAEAPTRGSTTLSMPFSIRKIYAEKDAAIRASISDDKVRIQAKENLGIEGTSVTVQLIDGRMVPFIITPSNRHFTTETSPSFANARAQFKAPALTQKNFSLAQFVNELDKSATDASFTPSFKYFGKLIFDDGNLRGMISQSFIGPKYSVHVIDVQNVSDTTQILNSELFQFKGLVSVKYARSKLESYAMGMGYGRSATKAYVLVRSQT